MTFIGLALLSVCEIDLDNMMGTAESFSSRPASLRKAVGFLWGARGLTGDGRIQHMVVVQKSRRILG
jgi:hypothetical protein